jgi:hypothetical protein
VQDVKGPWSNKKVLAEVVPGLVVLGDGAEKGKQTAVGVGVPELLDTIDTERPSRWQSGRQLKTVFVTKGSVGLGTVLRVRHLMRGILGQLTLTYSMFPPGPDHSPK